MAFSLEAGSAAGGWAARAVERSLEPARARSVERSHRVVAAARALAVETGSAAFTVAQVAERAGLSLKSIYRCFEGKDELLLAVLEEESRVGAGLIAEQLTGIDDPVARLHEFVNAIIELAAHRSTRGYSGVLLQEERRLAETHPDELRAAIAPFLDELAASLTAAGASSGDAQRDAETMFGVVLSSIHEVALGRRDPGDAAAFTWRFCWSGLEPRP